MCCSVLQCVLQCVKRHSHVMTHLYAKWLIHLCGMALSFATASSHTATRTAIHCNTLQHTATSYVTWHAQSATADGWCIVEEMLRCVAVIHDDVAAWCSNSCWCCGVLQSFVTMLLRVARIHADIAMRCRISCRCCNVLCCSNSWKWCSRSRQCWCVLQ